MIKLEIPPFDRYQGNNWFMQESSMGPKLMAENLMRNGISI